MQTPVTRSTTVNMALSDNVYKPLTIPAPFTSLLIDLGTSFDSSTLTIKIVQVIIKNRKPGDGDEVSAVITPEKGFDTAVRINVKEAGSLKEGEMYRFSIGYKSQSAKIFQHKEKSGYIAINYTLNKDLTIAALEGNRNMVVCISDIHLGQDDRYAECRQNRTPLTAFLKTLNASQNVSELVIAGDLIDEWVIPATENPDGDDPKFNFAQRVRNNNEDVFGAFNDVCENTDIKATYIPGNHDLRIDAAQISSVFPGMNQARDGEGILPGVGLGSYTPDNFPQAVIEHGHRYNFFCAPCIPVKNDPDEQTILPPGYFLTRIATEAFCHPELHKYELPQTEELYGDKNSYLLSQYSAMCLSNLKMLPVRYTSDEKFIKTDFGAKEYSIDDLVPLPVDGKLVSKLYKTISDNENWNIRQDRNNVQRRIPTAEAIQQSNSALETDSMANVQYFANNDSNKSIVIFGHSHVPRINTYRTAHHKTGIYANTGTWIDNNSLGSTMTFVTLIGSKNNESAPVFVNLYQYSPEGEIVLVDSQATLVERMLS